MNNVSFVKYTGFTILLGPNIDDSARFKRASDYLAVDESALIALWRNRI